MKVMGAMTATASTPATTGDATGPKQTKTKAKVVRKGLAARPYRRLEQDVLDGRLKDTAKKLAVHQSKIVLLQDKLDQYEREASLREQCDQTET